MTPTEKRPDAPLRHGLRRLRAAGVGGIAVLTVLYVMTGALGLMLSPVDRFATQVWSPTGMSLAALVLIGPRLWPGVMLGALLVNLWQGAPWPVALGISVGNTLEAVAAAWALRRIPGFRVSLDRFGDVLALILLCAVLSTTISATLGVMSLALGGLAPPADIPVTWRAWWMGNLVSDVVIAPLFFTWASMPAERPTARSIGEVALLGCLLMGLSQLVFSRPAGPSEHAALQPYLLFLPLIWATLRYGSRGAATATFVVSAGAIWNTYAGNGPFVRNDAPESLTFLNVFIASTAISQLVLGAVVSERQRSRAALAEKEALLRAVVEGTSDAVFVKNRLGRYVLMNKAGSEVSGVPVGDAVGRMDSDVLAPELARAIGEADREIMARGETKTIEQEIHPVGGTRCFLTVKAPWRDAAGQILGVISIARDITQRTQAERAAARLAAIVESADDAIIGQSLDGIIENWNPAARRIFGYAPHEVVGRSAAVLFPAGATNERREILEQIRRGEHVHQESVCIRKDGSAFHVSRAVSPITDHAGRIVGASTIMRDITRLKREADAARFLADSTSLLMSSLDYESTLGAVTRLAVPGFADACAVHVVGEDGRLHMLAFGHSDPSRQELAWQLERRYPLPADSDKGPPAVVRTGRAEFLPNTPDPVLAELAQDDAHLAILRSLGIRSYLCVPLTGRDGPLGTLTFTRSITNLQYDALDLRVAEDLASRAALAIDNAQLYAEAREAARAREEFLSIASHELKTPLTSLQLQLQVLRRQAPGSPMNARPDAPKLLAGMEKGVKRLTELIDNLLDITRITAGRLELNREEVDIDELVALVVERSSDLATRSGSTVSVRVESRDAMIGCWDRLRLDQVITNLLSNAVKYGRGKPIVIRLSGDDERVVLSVEDHGIGISQEEQKRLFARFERAASGRHYGGFGLGLWIVRQVVDAHGGEVSVESRPGEGSKFTVTLPRVLHRPDFEPRATPTLH